MIKVSPSVLACDFSKMGEEILRVYRAGAEYIHLDVMDGRFVSNISFGAPVIAGCRKVCDIVFDVHLMIEEPIRYVADFAKAGADIITVHSEACTDLRATVDAIHRLGKKAGVSVKPGTPVSDLREIAADLDLILIMSVEPGFGGQKFMPVALEKLREARAMIDACGKPVDLEVDGGVGADNVDAVLEAGADVIVAGSAVYKAADVGAMIARLHGQH